MGCGGFAGRFSRRLYVVAHGRCDHKHYEPFAFILVLGIVVDDAIIVAESAHAETEKSGYSLKSIVVGTKKVALPATFGVLTTVAAFLPLLLVTGPPSAMNQALAY